MKRSINKYFDIASIDGKLNDDEKGELYSLAEQIASGKVMLFLGAAVHCPPPPPFESFYPSQFQPPLGRDLGKKLAAAFPFEIGKRISLDWVESYLKENKTSEDFKKQINQIIDEKKDYTLSWIAQYYQGKLSRSQLVNRINELLRNKQPSPLVCALAEMNFPYIITTNYDNLFETALQMIEPKKNKQNKGIYKPNKLIPEITQDFPDDQITSESPFIYKIHGDIDDVFQSNNRYNSERDALVITDEDYIHFILRMGEKNGLKKESNFNPIPYSFNKALAEPDDITVLFMGYSLMDYNLRLLFKSAMWKKNIEIQLRKWSVDMNPDPTVRKIFEGNYTITFIENNAWYAIPFLYNEIFNRPMPLYDYQ
jgi:hypothetical protein